MKYIRYVEHELEEWRLATGWWDQALIYADDIVLIVDTERKLQVAADEWKETLEEKGMEINTTKSKVMQVAKTEDLEGQLNIHCKGIQMEQVTKFEYLGTIFIILILNWYHLHKLMGHSYPVPS